MRTPSLRRRVVLWSIGVLALLLLVVGVGVDLALGTVLKQEQRERLASIASLGSTLTGLSDKSLADRLAAFGIRVTISDGSGQEVVGRADTPADPGRGPRPPAPGSVQGGAQPSFTEEDGQLVATQTLRPGTVLTLKSDSSQIDAALLRFRVIMAIASVLAIGIAAVALPVVLRRAMRPLEALTDAARDTAAGDRGRRLDPMDPETDLGRAASQFDSMLEELEGAEFRAEEAAERLRRFLSDASHELRTPLAGVSAAAERLVREPLEADARDRVAVSIVRESRRASRLVDDLLLVSRLGELRTTSEPRALLPVLRLAADRATAQRSAPAVEVSSAGASGADPSGVDPVALIDEERFGQVLANLIANARNAGAAAVRLHTARVGDEVEVRVSDDGPGIPPESRELVFERLVRLDPARSAAHGGAGLGLSIARGLIEAQGGTLACVDAAEQDLPGAVFRIRLQGADPAEPRPSAPVPSIAASAAPSAAPAPARLDS